MKTIKVNSSNEIPINFTGIVEGADGNKAWYKEDKLHRLDGPAREYATGAKFWHKEGKWHRLGGPAIEYPNGNKYWYKEGKCHRLDGPAKEYANGDKEWWVDGKKVTEKEFPQAVLDYKLKKVLES